MKKFCFLFPLVMSMAIFASGCDWLERQQQNESAEQPSATITVNESSIWSQQECDEAVKFAQEVVDAVKGKNIEKLSTMINYPITVQVGSSENQVEIKNKEEFLTLKFDEIFTDKMCSKIIETTELFSNQNGFMMGSGEIWLSPVEGQMKIITINRT